MNDSDNSSKVKSVYGKNANGLYIAWSERVIDAIRRKQSEGVPLKTIAYDLGIRPNALQGGLRRRPKYRDEPEVLAIIEAVQRHRRKP
jgi:hypothetical protein